MVGLNAITGKVEAKYSGHDDAVVSMTVSHTVWRIDLTDLSLKCFLI